MPGALSLMSITVFAAAEDKPNTTLNRDELSLYTAPQQKFRYVEHEAGRLEQGVTTLRKMVEPFSAWCQGACGKVKQKFQRVIQIGNESYTHLKNPPADFYPRAGVIGFAGIVGLFFARGSRIKKLIYPAGLMTVGASLYYPEQAAAITKSTGDTVYNWALQSYVAIDKRMNADRKPVAEKQIQQEKPEKSSTSES